MHRRCLFGLAAALSCLSLACNLLSLAGSPTLAGATAFPSATPFSPAERVTAAPTEADLAAASPVGPPAEAIFIAEPGPGSRLVSPVRVSGLADPTFEQNLSIRLLNADGKEIASLATSIQAEIGRRGPFTADLTYESDSEGAGFLQVYATSPRDGGITHLATVGVSLALTGPSQILPATAAAEQIWIDWPKPGDSALSGLVHVEGLARASFEQSLLIQVLDGAGNTVGSQAVTVQSPEMGQPGPFFAAVPYTVAAAGPGRVVVRDLSPAFAGDLHLASVDIQLEP
jgi:hypothetical protein